MKLKILIILSSLGLYAMEAPVKDAPRAFIKMLQEDWQKGWSNLTSSLVVKVTESGESGHRTIILNEAQAVEVADKIKIVLRKRPNEATNNKLVVIFVHKGDESYAKLFANPATLDSVKKMAYDIANNRFASNLQKSQSLASSIPVPASEIDIISYAYDPRNAAGGVNVEQQAKLLDLFIHTLESLNDGKNLKIAIVAAEESAHLVNLMTREAKRNPIDSLIYFQSPVYEWSSGVTSYNYQEAMSPKNFVHLYNIYTKGAPQIAGWSGKALIYTERKYRQQARVENGKLVSPVKNIRALRVNDAGQLENFRLEDFFVKNALKNYGSLFSQADNYHVNSDLIAKVFDQSEGAASVAVNRFVRLNGNVIEQSVGASLVGAEYYYPVITLKEVSLENLRRPFTLEVEESTGQLINITSLPVQEGSFAIRSLLGDVASDINRIKVMHSKIFSSPLYELRIDPSANQFAYLITNKVKTALTTISQHSGLSVPFIEGQIKLGAYYLNSLLNNQGASIPTAGQEQYLRSIIALVWFLYSQAMENNQTFEEGTFVLEDLDWRVYDFLMNYVATYGATVSGFKKQKRFDQPLTQTLQDPDLNVTFNGFAYPRESSHFKVSQKQFRHYGIDIRFGNSGELPLLPASKRHLLFGKIDEERHLMFIKPENYGIYYQDGFLYHGAEFIESNARKWGFTNKTDDDPSYAKERIPAGFLKELAQALESSNLPDKTKSEVLALAKQDNWGIKILYFDALLSQPAIAALEQKYTKEFKNMRLRSGREVVLTNQDLRTVLNQRAQAEQKKVAFRSQRKVQTA